MADLSGFEVMVLIDEVDSALRGAYVNNIYTLGDAQVLRLRRQEGGDAWLVASPRHGVWLSEKVAERGETGEFTTRLRRELERARFSGAQQAGLDRVFVLKFGEGEEARRLVVELMPPGNIILTDAGGRILLARDEVRSKARRVVRGGTYAAPSQSRLSPAEVTREDVASMARAEETAGRALGRHVALPRKYVDEALARLSLGQDADSSALEVRGEEVPRVLREMVQEARERPRPCLCASAGGDQILAFAPRSMEVKKEFPTLSALCDDLLLPAVVEGVGLADAEGDRARRELEATLSKLMSEESGLRTKAAELRRSAQDVSGASSTAEAVKALAGAGISPRSAPGSPAAAASLIFAEAKRLEERARASKEAAERLSRKAPRAGAAGARATRMLSRRKAEWYEKFRWFFTSGGKLAIGGRDAQSNSLLVRRHLEDGDSVYHADLFGSPFFVLKGGGSQTEEEVREVAQATVAFSSAWKTGLGSADAYWVSPDQVSAAAPSGEYLARGSFAIKGKKNFVTRNLVEVAVGLDAAGRVVSGPEAAIARGARAYVVLRPHKEKGSETAKRVLRDLAPAAVPGGPGVDDVLRALPPGGGKVVRRGSPGEKAPRGPGPLGE